MATQPPTWVTLDKCPNYEITRCGRIRSSKTWRELKPQNKKGVAVVQLTIASGKVKDFRIHKLVSETFNAHIKPEFVPGSILKIWRSIDVAKRYIVSNYGDVMNKSRCKVKKLEIDKGKLRVGFMVNSKVQYFPVDKLVADAFLHQPEGKTLLKHIGEKTDNRAWMLKWVRGIEKPAAREPVESLEGERWRKIPDFAKYHVSNMGRVRKAKTGQLLKLERLRTGYLRAYMVDDDKKKYHKMVHRLVAGSFIENPEGKEQVNHLVAKDDNRACALEWTTASENMTHAYRSIKKVYVHPVRRIDPTTGETRDYNSMAEAEADGFRYTSISSVLAGRIKTTGGYRWESLLERPNEPEYPDEIWRRVEDSVYPELNQYRRYEVSNYGRIKSYHGPLLKTHRGCVLLSRDGESRSFLIHRVVLMAFNVPNPDGKTEVDHLDSDFGNNHLDNLRWATAVENMSNPATIAKRYRGQIRRIGDGEKLYRDIVEVRADGFHRGPVYHAINHGGTYRGYEWELVPQKKTSM